MFGREGRHSRETEETISGEYAAMSFHEPTREELQARVCQLERELADTQAWYDQYTYRAVSAA